MGSKKLKALVVAGELKVPLAREERLKELRKKYERSNFPLLLKESGYQVVTHDGGRGLSSLIFKERPDVVLVDVMMPRLSGDQVVELIKEHHLFEDLDIIYIFYSVKEPSQLAPIVKRTGARGAIHKSVSDEEFLAQFARLTEAV